MKAWPAAVAGTPGTMDETTQPPTDDPRDLTAPPAPTHEASSPPSNPEPDERAVREGEDKLGQAGAGH